MIRLIPRLINKDTNFNVALSMGVDSVAALHWLRSKGYRVRAIHFNHKLRPQNDVMAEKAKEFCSIHNISLFIGERGPYEHISTEKQCREARLRFFWGCTHYPIITAHHVNDWVEGYLLNCFRGQPNRQPIPMRSVYLNMEIYHPFLLSRKRDFLEYVERNKLSRFVVIDETNSEEKGSRRNWIRNVIIPELEQNEVRLVKFAKRRIREEVPC